MEEPSQDQEINVNPTDQPPGTGVNLSLTDIDVLRDRIEQQKANKLKAEQLVSTLSRIKAREKATRRSTKPGEKKIEDGIANQATKRSGSNSSNALKEKSNLLKKKLEEDRAKFESKKGQEDLGRVSQIVEHIRVQLEDQDKTIQQMHSNFTATAKSPPPVEEVKPAEPDIPPEVKQRIADLEMKVLDLQENLREKDSVISARTQAITLLSEDMAKKGKNTLDTLEETRSQMKTMQANFVALEDRMNEERGRLREELDTKKVRMQQLEKNYRAAESARFDLSTRVAELQEKVVALQTRNLTLEEEVIEFENKTKELKEALENSNKQTIKMKAQFKAKLKAIEEERDMLRKEDRTNEELNRLRERIAELEDEKGNLQLHLVDFDEIQEVGNLLKERIAEMEEKLQRQESDLDSHIKAMTSLEAEKLDLIEAAAKKSAVLIEKEEMLKEFQRQIEQIQETKITAEMKCLELEEKLENFLNSENYSVLLKFELDKVNKKLLEYQETIGELSMKLESRGTEMREKVVDLQSPAGLKTMQDGASSLAEWQSRYSQLEEKLNSTLSYCEELEGRKKVLESENERLSIESANLLKTLHNMNSITIAKKTQSLDEEINVLKQTLAQKEIEICDVHQHNKTLEIEVNSLRLSLESTTVEMHHLYQQVEDLNITRQKIDDLNAAIENKGKELEETTSELDKRSRKLSEYKKFHKLKSEDVIRISHELETVSASSQQRIAELEAALSSAQKVEEDLRQELKELKDNMSKGSEPVDTKLQEQSLKMKKLAANVKLKTKLVKDLEAKIDELAKASQAKDIIISSLENEKANLQMLLVKNDQQELPPNVNELVEKCKSLETEINDLKEEFKLKTEELEHLKNSSSEKYETHVQIKELENENKKLGDMVETKSDQLRKMENEISEINGLNQSLLSELEHMQESYKQDALKNESVLDGFEQEMLGNKKDIVDLSNQLKDVTSKYEQAWAKLQEKEGYIEELEQQLERTRVRLLQIESTVEDRRRSLEEKAEMLGSRLCQAERNNEQLEKHEGELEQKIAYLLNTEEMLGNVLEKFKEENDELTKSLGESTDKNMQLSQELDNEREIVQKLTKEINNLQTSLVNYEKMAEDYETIKMQLRDSQEARDNQVKSLENRIVESEQYMETEMRRLLDKITLVEGERQEIVEKFNSLMIEKQMLEEEMFNLQQTISSVAKEELEQLKNNHENLAKELSKELEKRQEHIHKIRELESQVLNLTSNSEPPADVHNQEVVELKAQLDKEVTEKEKLKYELLKVKAKKQVDDVVSKAEETYFTMTTPTNEVESVFSVGFNLESAAGDVNQLLPEHSEASSLKDVDRVKELEDKLSDMISENTSLKSYLQELESRSQNLPENDGGLAESEDWAAGGKDDDDGWGWGSKDAMLEHEYIQKQRVNLELETKVLELEKRLCSFEEENQRLTEELKVSQTKCNKLLKRVKEFKNKSDSLERNSRERSVGFDDLDFAMQEELRLQIDKLEKILKECNSNLNLMQLEREGFLKRIDTLTSGNERLIEMKERQDIEVEMWQRRSNELQNKVQGLEWTMAELQAEQADSKNLEGNHELSVEDKQHFLANALEMEEKLNALAAENDYLQSLMVELKEKDKKKQTTSSEELNTEVNKGHEELDDVKYSQLKDENDRLFNVIQSLDDKRKVESQSTNDDVIEYSHRIESLMKENEWLSSTIEKLKAKTESDLSTHENFKTLNEKYHALIAENEYLRSTITELHEKLEKLKTKYDNIQTERNNYGAMVQSFDGSEQMTAIDKTDEVLSVVISPNSEESPVLFRGFTSPSGDVFQTSGDSLPKSISDTKSSGQVSALDMNASTSVGHKGDFFDTINLVSEAEIKYNAEEILQLQNIPELSSGNTEGLGKSNVEDYLTEIEGQTDGNHFSPVSWNPLSETSTGDLFTERTLQWNTELDVLNKKLQGKDDIISNLKEELNSKTTSRFVDLTPGTSDNFNDIFSQSEDNRESQVNYFVEQITNLTKTLHDKEVEIETLTDKKHKYKEMYINLAQEYNVKSPDQSNADNDQLVDQNVILNQLLEDKETELEIMNQQIDQTKVAKDNLQDELSFTLCEMEANSAFAIPELPKNIFSSSSQPENIEDVRTLCEEVTELTKLLQEKESEVEILKQRIDEARLEKEILIDDWKREIEKYKEKADKESAKAEQIEKELERFKGTILEDIEKQYKHEISLKEQQLMNAMNDLHNTNSFCQDIQAKVNHLEGSLKTCNSQNELLTKKLNDLKHLQTSIHLLTEEFHYGTEMSCLEKIQKLKESFIEIKTKFDEVKSEIEEKDKTILALKEKVNILEVGGGTNEKSIEQPLSSLPVKTFASEPFRTSTEQSSSDDDSNSRHLEAVQGRMVLMKEIQSLKQVLGMKDAEITRMSIALNEAQENIIKGEMRLINSEEEVLAHRLDEALYMLHLRDVRCDELALELMQLLEERDSLQLRLSTAIRFNEELRAKSKLLDEAAIKMEGEIDIPLGKEEEGGNKQQLKDKLDQLHNVGYRRDPGLQHDQQRRHHEQMQLFTNQPPQDESQQPSGFFNWIFGTSSSGPQDV